jgi:hypothetical protein
LRDEETHHTDKEIEIKEQMSFWIDEKAKTLTLSDGRQLRIDRFDNSRISAKNDDVQYEFNRNDGTLTYAGSQTEGNVTTTIIGSGHCEDASIEKTWIAAFIPGGLSRGKANCRSHETRPSRVGRIGPACPTPKGVCHCVYRTTPEQVGRSELGCHGWSNGHAIRQALHGEGRAIA